MGVPSINATPAGNTTFRFPQRKTIQCAFYYETSGQDGSLLSSTLARKANSMLMAHGLDLRVYPRVRGLSSDGGDLVFSYDQKIYSGNADETTSIFTAAKPVFDPPPEMLPVVFCTMVEDGKTAGSTKQVTVGGKSYTVVLIFVNNQNPDGVTLLHEIGHAAGLWPGTKADNVHPPWNRSAPPNLQNFMCTYGDLTPAEAPNFSRPLMRRDDVTAIATASFSVRTIESSLRPLDSL